MDNKQKFVVVLVALGTVIAAHIAALGGQALQSAVIKKIAAHVQNYSLEAFEPPGDSRVRKFTR